MKAPPSKRFDIIVAGGGPTALALCMAAAKAGGKVMRLGKDSAPAGRHYALGLRARVFLKNIGAEIPDAAVVNRFWLFANGRRTELGAEESGLESLCHVVSEAALLESMRRGTRDIPQVRTDSISDLQSGGDGATIRADGALLRASLIAAADGARSHLAALAGVGVYMRPFGQFALCGTLRAPLPPDVAAQWFSRGSILALLPTTADGMFSLIWSQPETEARRLMESGAAAIAREVARRTGMEVEWMEDSAFSMFPLFSVRRAVRVWGRVVFVGDGARVIHPLAGQGLNLALMDAEDLIGRASCFSDWGWSAALSSHASSRVLRAGTLHRATNFFAECEEGTAAGILTMARLLPPLSRAAARFANGY